MEERERERGREGEREREREREREGLINGVSINVNRQAATVNRNTS